MLRTSSTAARPTLSTSFGCPTRRHCISAPQVTCHLRVTKASPCCKLVACASHGSNVQLLTGRRRPVKPHRQPRLLTAAQLQLFNPFKQRSTEAAPARQLLELVASNSKDRAVYSQLVDELLALEVPFREAQIGNGPWEVVYTRGALLWQQVISPGASTQGKIVTSRNKASQEFRPADRRVINRGELLGRNLFVTAEGTYEPQDDRRRLPKLIKANVGGGALHVLGKTLPLPIRGSGLVYLAYLDDTLRIFRSEAGSLSVQVRADRLAEMRGSR